MKTEQHAILKLNIQNFTGSRGHLKSFSGDFFGVNLFTRMCFQIFGETFDS